MKNHQVSTDAVMFQVVSRKNDTNGNPFRLILVYNGMGTVVELYEARSSSPNQVHVLRQRNLFELPSFHLTPVEYRETKRSFGRIELISTY